MILVPVLLGATVGLIMGRARSNNSQVEEPLLGKATSVKSSWVRIGGERLFRPTHVGIRDDTAHAAEYADVLSRMCPELNQEYVALNLQSLVPGKDLLLTARPSGLETAPVVAYLVARYQPKVLNFESIEFPIHEQPHDMFFELTLLCTDKSVRGFSLGHRLIEAFHEYVDSFLEGSPARFQRAHIFLEDVSKIANFYESHGYAAQIKPDDLQRLAMCRFYLKKHHSQTLPLDEFKIYDAMQSRVYNDLGWFDRPDMATFFEIDDPVLPKGYRCTPEDYRQALLGVAPKFFKMRTVVRK